ncbi:hypothetical protein ZEAMMB73_Zm00001d033107 [Zea mays]|uniref:Uncharacterized protein n=1 Tax=Zea mays TaxID=4577 RepID=A0A1D6KWB9_MAIZE|nr:hypothetical protein ZEAMMB73_Zm00001d033107 [Zea mays]
MPASSPLADVLWPAPFDGPATARLRQVRTPPFPSSSFWKDSANFSRHPHHPPAQVPRGEHHHFLQPIVSAPRCSPQCPQTVRHNVQEKRHVNDSVAEPHSCPRETICKVLNHLEQMIVVLFLSTKHHKREGGAEGIVTYHLNVL